jgi:hypothetical protein
MGKRRQELDHKTRDQMEKDTDDEDEIVEENREREPLRQDQLDNIQSRKKLIAKRRVNDSVASTNKMSGFTPFSSLSTTVSSDFNFNSATKASDDKPSAFAGFKGFSGLKATAPASAEITKNPMQTINGHSTTPLSNSLSSNGMMQSAATAMPGGFSFLNSSTTATKKKEDSVTPIITTNANANNNNNNKSLNNIGDAELLFLNDLNQVYERHYGTNSNEDSKRKYLKLPDVSCIETEVNAAASTIESKYAFLLSELNKHCANWTSKHVKESPYSILTPIFFDYFHYLILLEKKFYPNTFSDKVNKLNGFSDQTTTTTKTTTTPTTTTKTPTTAPQPKPTSDLPMLSTFTTSKPTLNGHKNDKVQSQKPLSESVVDLTATDEKVLNDSSKTFASFMNKTASTLTPFNSIKLTPDTTMPTNNITNNSGHNENENKKIKNFDEISTLSSNSANLFKFGNSSSSSSNSSSSSGSSEASSSQKENNFLTSSSSTHSESSTTSSSSSTLTSTNLKQPVSNLFTNTITTNSAATSSFKFGSDSNVKETASANPVTNLFNRVSNQDTTDSPSNVTPSNTTTATTASNFFSFLNKESKPLTESSSSSKPSTTTTTNTTSTNLFSASLNQNQTGFTTPGTLLGSTGPTTLTNSSPFLGFQSILNSTPGGNKPNTLFGSSTFGAKSDISSVFGGGAGGSSIFGSTPSFGGASTFASADAGGSADADDEQYEPPKPETSDVKEEGALYEKRLKLFFYNEKEKKFTDRGVGNLYLKPMDDGASTQLIIRADNSLSSILLNVKLNKLFPISKEGTKNVSYMCMPNPPIPNVSTDVPCKFLFKVKTEDDATELFDQLNQLKR